MGITKIAAKVNVAQRNWKYTESAREAWSEILGVLKKENTEYKVLLPAYIGWSPNEGSGIFDSVKGSGLGFDFYNLDKDLSIDFESLKDVVLNTPNVVVLLVHYFGFPDVKYKEIVAWLEERKIVYIEDCAHAWLTDLIGGQCGRNGRYSFYSLHKILPVSGGGLLVENFPIGKEETLLPYIDLGYDLFSIYQKRRDNYNYLVDKLKSFQDLEVIYNHLGEGICPQTLPVIVNNFDRNVLYQKMNELNIGMVSLYHTMIEELGKSESLAVMFTSKHIINFPVHQDIDFSDLDELIVKLKAVLNA